MRVLLIPLLFLSCQMPYQKKEQCNLEYFNSYISSHPNQLLGLGVAPPNFNGIAAQRKSAISKALDEIARQKGVKVTNATLKKAVNSNGMVDKNFATYSIQSVNNKKIKAKIIKACLGEDEKFYVLMQGY